MVNTTALLAVCYSCMVEAEDKSVEAGTLGENMALPNMGEAVHMVGTKICVLSLIILTTYGT